MPITSPRPFRVARVLASAAIVFAFGCANTKTSSTARTGVEQLLISNSVDQTLNKIDFQPLAGRAVYIEEKYIDCVDKTYIIGSVRHRVAAAGGRLVAKQETADVMLEVRSGGVGTDTSDMFVGIPEITLPGMVTLPEVKLINRMNQTGTAKLGLVAYDARTMQVLGEGGVSLARSDDNNWYVLGMGPYQNGSVRGEIARSTSGSNQFVRAELPTHVSFQAPQENPQESAGRLQYTSGSHDER